MSEGKLARYMGYTSKLTISLAAGAVLFDATADIDGLAHIVPHRVAVAVPQARYDNLDIVHVPPEIIGQQGNAEQITGCVTIICGRGFGP